MRHQAVPVTLLVQPLFLCCYFLCYCGHEHCIYCLLMFLPTVIVTTLLLSGYTVAVMLQPLVTGSVAVVTVAEVGRGGWGRPSQTQAC